MLIEKYQAAKGGYLFKSFISLHLKRGDPHEPVRSSMQPILRQMHQTRKPSPSTPLTLSNALPIRSGLPSWRGGALGPAVRLRRRSAGRKYCVSARSFQYGSSCKWVASHGDRDGTIGAARMTRQRRRGLSVGQRRRGSVPCGQ